MFTELLARGCLLLVEVRRSSAGEINPGGGELGGWKGRRRGRFGDSSEMMGGWWAARHLLLYPRLDHWNPQHSQPETPRTHTKECREREKERERGAVPKPHWFNHLLGGRENPGQHSSQNTQCQTRPMALTVKTIFQIVSFEKSAF